MEAIKRNLKRITIAAGLLLGSLVSVQAGEGDTRSLSRQISSQLSFPAELAQPDFNEKVKVDFRLKADGTAEVVHVHTSHIQLKSHVIKQFGQLHLDGKNADTEKVYRIEVKYRVI